ncbi:hypothetical protein QZH41_015067 [Actinostola sp. cb2023]|nr:hypothetical protein QZH41_015067 [Actinostola sp. cb2023]
MSLKVIEALASHIGKYPYDQVVYVCGFIQYFYLVAFVSCILSSYPLGLVYCHILHPSKVSSEARQIVGLVWGLCFGWICFQWHLFSIIGTTTLCYMLTNYVDPKYVHRPLMILVQKVTYVALSVHDGKGRDEKHLSSEQKQEQLKQVPSPLQYFGYVLHYSMLLSGPACTYRQYKDFINGSCTEVRITPVLKKSLVSLLCLLLFFNVTPRFPISLNADEHFIGSQPFLWRLLYSWISIIAIRMQYYFAFKTGEAINNLCGLGFSGYDNDGNALWDSMANVSILRVEFGLNFKMVLENWNISTVLWLRRYWSSSYNNFHIWSIYDRLTNHRTLGVFVLTAVWHGFYGGYYLTFITCQLMVEAARAVRRTLRDKFQRTPLLSRVYDVITCVTTVVCLTYATVPFALLDLWAGLRFWRSMYYFGHVIAFLVLLMLRGKSTRAKVLTESPDTNQNGVASIDKKYQ